MTGKHEAKTKSKRKGLMSRPISHLSSLGFTNRFGVYILLFLAAGLLGGFYLARESIQHQYIGALACWTAVFAPIGTAASVVLSKIVDKSKAENTSADGEGIKYAVAKAAGFMQDMGSDESPAI